jgi:hypothetical protein
LRKRFITCAISTPPTVPTAKATSAQDQDAEGLGRQELLGGQLRADGEPQQMVTMLIRALAMVSERRSATPHSRARLPNISAPISGTAEGRKQAAEDHHEREDDLLELGDGRSCFMRMRRSFSVVRAS